ncbi:hypothetical protein [Parapedobacter tibetensis]|uniref:hypothetical protein n=1 Tax=Parapedobacter tibetensis TaxID=2972951 RepID=UPI00214D4D2C|nr:hypothetical protein [Parapedobacter tibetensis]
MNKQELLVMVMLYFMLASPVFAQYEYRVGSGQASIEPDDRYFSLTLAGYGVPPEGRFTLEWTEIRPLGTVADAAMSAAGTLYYLEKGGLWTLDPSAAQAIPKELLPEADVRLLAVDHKRLYGINQANELLEMNPLSRRPRWHTIAALDKQAVAFAATDDGFVLVDAKGICWLSKGRSNVLSWTALIAEPLPLADIAWREGTLYGLTPENELLRLRQDDTWVRIALRNGLTYQQDIRQIIAADDGFHGIDADGTWLDAGHNSTKQLSAGAVSIASMGKRVIIVGIDVCGFNADFATNIKKAVYEQYGVPPTAVLINASHTHFAPVTQSWPTWAPHCQKPDSSYLYSVVKSGILDAISQAMRSEQPADLYFGRTVADIGRNRNLKGDNLPYDNALDVVKIAYRKQDSLSVVFLAGCHPVFTNAGQEGITISPNYPGVAREALVRHSKIKQALFLQGCAGDINPKDDDHTVTAQKVVSAVHEALEGSMQHITGSINNYLDTINFDSRPWPVERIKQFRKENEDREGNVVAEKNVRWADLMLGYHKTGTMPTQMPVYVQTINIGNWKLVGLSREATTEYSLGIKKLWPEKLVSVAAYSNDVASYLPTQLHIQAGVYEGKDSFFWYGQPNIFPEDVYETIINRIKANNR